MQEDDVARQLTELAELRSSGMLTDGEYTAAKQRILRRREVPVETVTHAPQAGTGGRFVVDGPPPAAPTFPPAGSPGRPSPRRSSAWWPIVAGGVVTLMLALLIVVVGTGSRNGSDTPATALSPSAPGAGLPNPSPTSEAAPGPGQSVPLPIGSWTAVGASTIDQGTTAGSFQLRFDELYWGGAYAAPDVGCDYTLSGYGRIVQGNGFGVAVRTDMSSGSPEAQAFQYDSGIGGYRITQYPTDGGSVIRAATDTSWHRITMSVSDSQYEVSVDDEVVAAGATTLRCGGVYLRVWEGGIAEFRDMTVAPK